MCDDYTDVMANLARNDIQESLRDLGPDTVYAQGQPVSADVESSVPSQRTCRPLPNWRLTLGEGYTGKTPDTLQLSTVTGAYDTSIVTRASTPLLDPAGQPTGRSIAGAVTVPLTSAQLQRAQQGNSLWVQGGTPAEPLNGRESDFGFAALRCAVDNLNGDNVEWIGFPAQARHVFCYYYAITPPPGSGTIVVRKEITSDSSGPESFDYDGNLSYNPGGAFTLSAANGSPGEQEFIRGAVTGSAPPWTFSELPRAGWELTGGQPVCTSRDDSSGIDIDGPSVSVTLAEGDLVTCTYSNRRETTAPLSLSKVSLGGTGTFDFDIETPDSTLQRQVTTTRQGVGVLVASTPGSSPGQYTVTETLPADSAGGTWAVDSVICDGNDVPYTQQTAPDGRTQATGSLQIGPNQSVDCTVANRFTPARARSSSTRSPRAASARSDTRSSASDRSSLRATGSPRPRPRRRRASPPWPPATRPRRCR